MLAGYGVIWRMKCTFNPNYDETDPVDDKDTRKVSLEIENVIIETLKKTASSHRKSSNINNKQTSKEADIINICMGKHRGRSVLLNRCVHFSICRLKLLMGFFRYHYGPGVPS